MSAPRVFAQFANISFFDPPLHSLRKARPPAPSPSPRERRAWI